jgi:hypothetical protein
VLLILVYSPHLIGVHRIIIHLLFPLALSLEAGLLLPPLGAERWHHIGNLEQSNIRCVIIIQEALFGLRIVLSLLHRVVNFPQLLRVVPNAFYGAALVLEHGDLHLHDGCARPADLPCGLLRPFIAELSYWYSLFFPVRCLHLPSPLLPVTPPMLLVLEKVLQLGVRCVHIREVAVQAQVSQDPGRYLNLTIFS